MNPREADPFLSTHDIIRLYPFLKGPDKNPLQKIHRKRQYGSFPKADGQMGKELLWLQSTIEAAIEDGLKGEA